MRNFVVGDIQGCYKGLRQGLKKIGFDPQHDKLWAVGDLIARGPQSLETLDFLRDLGEQFESVLGNHDLHLIAIAHGVSSPKPQDKLTALLRDAHFDDYIAWLLQKPLALKPAKKHFISHAGLYPAWSIKQALKLSQEVSTRLQSPNLQAFLTSMYGNTPALWDDTLQGDDRLRFIVNALTRMRYIQGQSLELKSKCHPSLAGKNIKPWFTVPNPVLKSKQTVIFGHWASLLGQTARANIIGLDTGYVWGKHMTFYEIESSAFFYVQA